MWKKCEKIYYFCLTILSLVASFCFIHDFLLKKSALGKREFLKVGLRLINIQGASLLSLKFVAAIFYPTDLISQAELEILDVAGTLTWLYVTLGHSGCGGGQSPVTSVVKLSMHSPLTILNPYPRVWYLISRKLCFVFPVIYWSKTPGEQLGYSDLVKVTWKSVLEQGSGMLFPLGW